jgi:hypothetical protein
VDFHGEKRSNETHASTTDSEAKLARKKGKESKMSYSAHALMENRNGLVLDFRVEEANGYAERNTAIEMLYKHATKNRRVTVGADAGYDTADFVARCRAIKRHTTHRADARHSMEISHRRHLVSQRKRKLVEEIFGWIETIGGFRRIRFRGRRRTQLAAALVVATYNLLRICRLVPVAA